MAAAVYLHNALFGQPSRTSTDNFRRDTGENGGSDSEDGESEEMEEADVANAHPGSSRAPSSSSPMSRTDVLVHPIPNVNEPQTSTSHGRKLSASSQTTLVPITRARYSQVPVTSLEHPLQEEQQEQQQVEQVAEEDQDREVARPASSSPLPPGLPTPAAAAATTTQHHQPSSRRPLTPYPFPSDEAADAAAATRTRSRSHSHSRSRPRGRRRDDDEQGEHKTPHRKRYTPPHLRTGRIPNPAFSHRTRLVILAVRFLLGLVLCGWSAYSCARYWLAYQEFDSEVKDPPRSQYALVLAITCTIATALLVLDSAWFLYFVLYPHDGRLLTRIPTLAPITRDTTIPVDNNPAVVNDGTDDTDGSPQPQARTSRTSRAPRIPVPPVSAQEDRFTSMPNRNSAFSAASSYRKSRRLSKIRRPDSWAGEPLEFEAEPVNQQAPPRHEEQQQQAPPSRFVEPTTAPKSDPHSRRTYTLQLPSLCHEPSISPLPFPPLVPSHQRAPHTRPHRSRKWRRTRPFLHLIHWLAFIALNIPGFVNVALVPVWYEPSPTIDRFNNGSNLNTGINSPHRLAGLCDWSPDVIWAGTALPPSHPPPCASTIPYKVWLWSAIGRVLLTFFVAGLWIVMDGVWWGAWVVGTRRIGWKGALGRPWGPRRSARTKEEVVGTDESEVPGPERGETLWAKRIRLLSGASGRSGRSGKSLKEKPSDLVMPVHSPPPATATTIGADLQDALASSGPVHRVRRKPVSAISPGETYSLNSPPLPPPHGSFSYFEQVKMPGGGIGSRRPSAQDSIGGSTVVGSPPTATFLPSSPVFSPASPPSSSFSEHTSFGNAGRRSMALEIVPELEGRSSDEREAEARGDSPEMERRYPDRPQSRLSRYDDAPYRPRAPSPPSPLSPTYPPSPTRVGWAVDPNTFSPITSPGTDAPLLGRGYFMVGDGGFSAGNMNEGAYDEDSYYRAISADVQRQQTANRGMSPNSERSNSPNSYGHVIDVRVETPSGGDEDDTPELPQLVPVTQGQWAQPNVYQHPLAMGIQMAMGQPPPEFEREVRMLGSVVRRMSTIESLGSHERELSRRGSAATARTTQTGRGNSAGTAQREGTNGSGNSGPMSPLLATNGSGDRSGGSGGQTEADPIIGTVRASSPVDMSPA